MPYVAIWFVYEIISVTFGYFGREQWFSSWELSCFDCKNEDADRTFSNRCVVAGISVDIMCNKPQSKKRKLTLENARKTRLRNMLGTGAHCLTPCSFRIRCYGVRLTTAWTMLNEGLSRYSALKIVLSWGQGLSLEITHVRYITSTPEVIMCHRVSVELNTYTLKRKLCNKPIARVFRC